MRRIEDEYWWYRALRAQVVASVQPRLPEFALLDAGCGTGGMLATLRRRFPMANLSGVDVSERALELTAARSSGAQLMRSSADELPFADGEFDVVLSLDVLTHRGVDDAAVAREAHRVLRPKGTFIVNVAAFEFLRGSHDAAVDVVRRYTRRGLAALLARAGFAIRALTYWNFTLLPAVALARWRSRRRAQQPAVASDLVPLWPPLDALLGGIARAEFAIARRWPLPFGTSVFAVACK